MKVLDGLRAGEKPREIAKDIYGADEVKAEWYTDGGMRSQVRRWISKARAPRRGRLARSGSPQRVRRMTGIGCGMSRMSMVWQSGDELWPGTDIGPACRRSETPVLSMFQARDPGASRERLDGTANSLLRRAVDKCGRSGPYVGLNPVTS